MLDAISDMLTRIRNAQMAGHSEVEFPFSKLKMAIAKVIAKKEFIEGVKVEKGESFDTIKVTLKYKEKNGKKYPAISGIRRVSTEGQRIYIKKDNIKNVKNGYGFKIISTSKGILTGAQARENGVGGEVICEIW